jgi:hypothetical protein
MRVFEDLGGHRSAFAPGGSPAIRSLERAVRQVKYLVAKFGWEVMLEDMGWQEIAALAIVGLTGAVFLWNRFRRRPLSFQRHSHCGCTAPVQTSPQSSIVFHARKGGPSRVVVKMR